MKSFFKGALTVTVGMTACKIIGAFYRIPLTVLLGSEGIGIYQMVFPFYTMLLTISSTGIPTGLSKLIGEGKNATSVLRKSLKLFGVIGGFLAVLMMIFSFRLASLQGNVDGGYCFLLLAPSVFIVSIISVFRGYFQGKMNMFPTAFSQIVEQVVKLVFGLSFAYFLPVSIKLKSAFCCLAVTISEIICLVWLVVEFRKQKGCQKQTVGLEISLKEIVKLIAPITIVSILLPISRVADSFLSVNLLPFDVAKNTSLYGIYTGGVETLISVPIAVCYGISVSAIPFLSADKKNNKTAYNTFFITILLSLSASVVTFSLSKPVVNLLFSRFSFEEKTIMIDLLKISSCQIVFLSCLQALNSLFIARNLANVLPFGMLLGLIVKIVALTVLLPSERIGVFGLAISDILCYFVAIAFDLLYIVVGRFLKTKRNRLGSSTN